MLSYCLKTTIPGGVGWVGWVGELRNKTNLQPSSVEVELWRSLEITSLIQYVWQTQNRVCGYSPSNQTPGASTLFLWMIKRHKLVNGWINRTAAYSLHDYAEQVSVGNAPNFVTKIYICGTITDWDILIGTIMDCNIHMKRTPRARSSEQTTSPGTIIKNYFPRKNEIYL